MVDSNQLYVNEFIKSDRDIQMEYPNYKMIEIENMGTFGINVSQLLNFVDENGVRSDYNVKYCNLLMDLEYTNEKLLRHYKMHDWLKTVNTSNDELVCMAYGYILKKYIKETKEIVHDLKYTIDQLLTITALLLGDKYYVDCIGEWLKKKDSKNAKIVEFYKEFTIYLKNINDIENSYKHHFTNGIKTMIDRKESIVSVQYCRDYRDWPENYRVIEIPMLDIIKEFNEFLKKSKEILKQLSSVN